MDLSGTSVRESTLIPSASGRVASDSDGTGEKEEEEKDGAGEGMGEGSALSISLSLCTVLAVRDRGGESRSLLE